MQLSARGLLLIQQFEGFSRLPYADVAGLLTIGYGHWLRPHEAKTYPQGISDEQAEHLLRQDVAGAVHAVNWLITSPQQQHQFDALVSFTYNLGSGVLQRSTLRRVINRGEDDAVDAQWRRFVWAGGRKVAGLVRRREAELALYFENSSDVG